ncbi:MAG: ATP synthase F1 subunit delta [Sphingobacteriales bacterium]|nr:MAG: ATP synthase F1 subunit delta [Sphingobacteriales bacterium]
MQNPRLAARYAKSLLDMAVEQNQLESTLKDVEMLDQVGSQNREFVSMLRSPVIKGEKKNAILEALFGSRLNPLTKAFVTLLVSKGRERSLPEISSAFISQYKEMKNIRTVKLTTAVQLSRIAKDSIVSKVMGSLPQNQIDLKEEVDPELIGGFVLQMGDKLYDASIRRDLNDVRAQFTKNIYISQI